MARAGPLWESNDGGADPAHVLAQEAMSSLAKLANLEVFHAESLDRPVAADGFLKNLAEVSQPRLAALRRAADFSTELVHRQDNQRQEDGSAKAIFQFRKTSTPTKTRRVKPF